MKQCLKCLHHKFYSQSDVLNPDGTEPPEECKKYPDGIPDAIWINNKNCDLYFNPDDGPKRPKEVLK